MHRVLVFVKYSSRDQQSYDLIVVIYRALGNSLMILEYVFVVSRQFSILIFSISVAKFLFFSKLHIFLFAFQII